MATISICHPDFFTIRHRTYKPVIPIGGKVWHGANAAHVASQLQLDLLIGTTDENYHLYMASRFNHMLEVDRTALQRDVALPSVTEQICKLLNISSEIVKTLTLSDVCMQIVQHVTENATTAETLRAYRQLILNYGRASAMHWSLIQNFIVKFARTLSEEQKSRLAIDPKIGASGKSFEAIKHLMEVRRRHPIAGKLAAAIKTTLEC